MEGQGDSMPITNAQSGTRIDEITTGIFRISTPVPPNPALPAGFSFNQFLVAAEAPLLFHTGLHKLFPLTLEALRTVIKPETLRYVAFSHTEPDESGALAEWLDVAPNAVPVCSRVASMITVPDVTDRPAVALADGETLDLGSHRMHWFDAPHVPHGWDCGFMGELSTHTLLCGDLFTQAGATNAPVTESDVLAPSEAMRGAMDYFAHGANTASVLGRLASFEPRLLACMHGSSYRGDGAKALRDLSAALTQRA
jgi:flavorubredoxin